MLAVIGTGTWGTAVAQLLAERGHPVMLWGRRQAVTDRLASERTHPFLPDVRLHDNVTPTAAAHDLGRCRHWLWAVPTQYTAATARDLAAQVANNTPQALTSLSKGIDIDSGKRVSEMLQATFPSADVAALSGPSHAEEIMHGLPAGLVAAGPRTLTAELVDLLHDDKLRIYHSNDLLGVELGGALKNVIAIAAGICEGLELGNNTKALLVTRGVAEISRLATRLGAEPKTIAGLAGIGDLLTTCYSEFGRNQSLGRALAKGVSVAEWEQQRQAVAEGAWTSRAVQQCFDDPDCELPICEQVYQLCWEGAPVEEAVKGLLGRRPKEE